MRVRGYMHMRNKRIMRKNCAGAAAKREEDPRALTINRANSYDQRSRIYAAITLS